MTLLLLIESTIFVIVAIFSLILGYAILRSNPRSATNQIYSVLTLVMSAWAVVVHYSLAPAGDEPLFWIRLSIFLATMMSTLFFLLAHTIPSTQLRLPPLQLVTLTFLTVFVMVITISPFAFTGLYLNKGVITPVAGPGLVIFGLFVLSTSGGAVYLLWKRQLTAKNNEKQQLRSVMKGILLMYGLMIFLIFLPLAAFGVTTLVPLFPAITLVFTGLTAYAIVQYRLFNMKVIAVEALTVVLWVTLFSKVFSADQDEVAVNTMIFLVSLVFGLLLIRSVRKEIRQREELEILSKELESANDQLKVLDKARAEFISIASHQLRTPPATIKWYLAAVLAGDYGKISPKIREAIARAQLTNNGLIGLIDDLLNVSRIERGKMEFLFEETDVLKMIDQVVNDLTPLAAMRKLQLIYERPTSKYPTILADKEKLSQVVNNTIDNAIKYTKKGTITVIVSKTPKDIIIKIQDTGKGLDKGEEIEIFNKYGRGKDSQKQASGLGLGLYVAKVIVEHHQGKIYAESPGLGKGTTFIVKLPIQTDLKADIFDLTQQQ